MGIRFACHHCNHALHVKDFQAGKRGRCPDCKQSFRIPLSDATYSDSIEDEVLQPIGAKQADLKKATLDALSGGDIFSESTPAARTSSNPTIPSKPKDRAPSTDAAHVVKTKSLDDSDIEIPAAEESHDEPLWFVRPPSGGQFGPAPTSLLQEWMQERRVTEDSYLWCEGMQDWKLAAELFRDRFDLTETGVADVLPGVEQIGTAERRDPVEDIFQGNADNGSELSISPAGIAIKKKAKKRQQQWTFVVILGTVSLILLVALIYVLFFQVTKSTLAN